MTPGRAPRRHCALAAVATTLLLHALALPAGATEPGIGSPPDSAHALRLPSPEVARSRSLSATGIPLLLGAGLVLGDIATGGEGYVALTGVAIGTCGIVFGPAAGYAYGGLGGRAALGVGVRLALVVSLPIVAVMNTSSSDDAAWAGAGGFLLGSALALGAAAIDVASVHGAVERRNHERRAAAGLSVAPALAPFSHAPGFAVTIPLGNGAR